VSDRVLETKMNKFFLGTAALVALAIATPASAADLPARYPTKAPPMVAPIWNWTGFYIGINGGYGWGRSDWTATSVLGAPIAPVREGRFTTDGFTAGGQIGYNWQVSQWVFGLEAQGNWADISGSRTSLAFPAFSNRTRVNAFGLFTGKIGYAWDNVLVYAKRGAAIQDIDHTYFVTATNVVGGRANETRVGASVGAGFEVAFAPNWSAGLEYNHMFMGRDNITFTPAPNSTDRIRLDTDIFTAKINYRFGGPMGSRY
jgi:outer membrane immunogenic protein